MLESFFSDECNKMSFTYSIYILPDFLGNLSFNNVHIQSLYFAVDIGMTVTNLEFNITALIDDNHQTCLTLSSHPGT